MQQPEGLEGIDLSHDYFTEDRLVLFSVSCRRQFILISMLLILRRNQRSLQRKCKTAHWKHRLIRPASCMSARASRKARRPGRGLSALAHGAEIRRPRVVHIFRQSGQIHSCVSADVVKWCYVFSYLFHIGYWVCIKYWLITDCLFCVFVILYDQFEKNNKIFLKDFILISR